MYFKFGFTAYLKDGPAEETEAFKGLGPSDSLETGLSLSSGSCTFSSALSNALPLSPTS